MRELKNEEQQWLKVFAQDNEFFKSLLEFFERNDYLTDKQFDCLARNIYKAEEEGDTVLDNEDLTFLKENAEDNEDLMEILESYEDNGFLDEYEYNQLIHLKHEFTKKEKGDRENEVQKSGDQHIKRKYDKMDPKKTIIRIPCPHCNSLCSPQVNFCAKCGEPIPKVETYKESKVILTPNISESNKSPETLKFNKLKEFLNNEFLSDNFKYEEIIYILKLDNNKWWIGKSKYILKQIESMKKGKANKWILENPIVSIEELIENGDIVSITLDYMERYGWENVQGSSWYEGQLDKYTPYRIKRYVSEKKVSTTEYNQNVEIKDQKTFNDES